MVVHSPSLEACKSTTPHLGMSCLTGRMITGCSESLARSALCLQQAGPGRFLTITSIIRRMTRERKSRIASVA